MLDYLVGISYELGNITHHIYRTKINFEKDRKPDLTIQGFLYTNTQIAINTC